MSEQSKPTALGKIPGELPEQVQADLAHLQGLSLAERARMLEAVCAATMDILVARRQMGIPDPEPEPYPASTWEFMRKHAAEWTKKSDPIG